MPETVKNMPVLKTEYSMIWHKNRSETVKNMPEKWIKNR